MHPSVQKIGYKLRDIALMVREKFLSYDQRDRIFISYLLVLAFFMYLMPVFSVNPLVDGDANSYYLLGSRSLFTTFIIITIAMCALVAWNMSIRAKNTMSTLFWLGQHTFLFNFVLLWVITSSYISIGETISAIKQLTPTVSVSTSYVIVQILLLIWLVYMVYMTVNSHKQGKQIIVRQDSLTRKEDEWSMGDLFDSMKDQDESS